MSASKSIFAKIGTKIASLSPKGKIILVIAAVFIISGGATAIFIANSRYDADDVSMSDSITVKNKKTDDTSSSETSDATSESKNQSSEDESAKESDQKTSKDDDADDSKTSKKDSEKTAKSASSDDETDKPHAIRNSSSKSASSESSSSNSSSSTDSSSSTSTTPTADYNLNDQFVAGYVELALNTLDEAGECVASGTKSFFGVTKFTGSTDDLRLAVWSQYVTYVETNGYTLDCGGLGASQMTWDEAVAQGIALDEAKCAEYGLSCDRR